MTSGSADSAGIAKHGAGRAFVGTASQLSNPTADNDGRLFWVTDTESLYVAQESSSSWSVVADAIKLDSENTWSALQEFTSDISTSDINVAGSFSGITSVTTLLGAAVGMAGEGDANIYVTNAPPTSRGDFMVGSADSVVEPSGGPGAIGYTMNPFIDSQGTLKVSVKNIAASRLTFPSSTTLNVLGFLF